MNNSINVYLTSNSYLRKLSDLTLHTINYFKYTGLNVKVSNNKHTIAYNYFQIEIKLSKRHIAITYSSSEAVRCDIEEILCAYINQLFKFDTIGLEATNLQSILSRLKDINVVKLQQQF